MDSLLQRVDHERKAVSMPQEWGEGFTRCTLILTQHRANIRAQES